MAKGLHGWLNEIEVPASCSGDPHHGSVLLSRRRIPKASKSAGTKGIGLDLANGKYSLYEAYFVQTVT